MNDSSTDQKDALVSPDLKKEFFNRATVIWFVCLIALSVVFVILKMYALNPTAGDEHIYLYQSKLIADGIAPYSGFPMAHPPIQTVFTAILFKLVGYHYIGSKLLPIVFCLAGGLLLAVILKRENGELAAVLGAFFYIFAYEPLRASSHFTGVNMAVTIFLCAVLAYRTGHFKTAALFCVAAVYTRLYMAPGVIVLCIAALFTSPKKALILIGTGIMGGLLTFLCIGLVCGFEDTINNMVMYHAQKTPMLADKLADMKNKVLFHNAKEVILFGLSIPLIILYFIGQFYKTKKNRFISRISSVITENKLALPLLGITTAVTFLIILTNMDRVWMYYFVPAFPFAAMSSAWLVSTWLHTGYTIVVHKGRLKHAGVSKVLLFFLAVSLMGFGYLYYQSPQLEQNLKYYAKEMEKSKVDRSHAYTWRDGRLPKALNQLIKNHLWTQIRVIGEPYNSLDYYFWHESRIFDVADTLVKEIKTRTEVDDQIFGDSGTVPLLALLSQRTIAGNEVDTNLQRYRSGNASPEALIEKIDSPKTKLIILRRGFGVFGVKQVQQLVKNKYKQVRVIRSFVGRTYLVFERRPQI